jgi:hypothetical protein
MEMFLIIITIARKFEKVFKDKLKK